MIETWNGLPDEIKAAFIGLFATMLLPLFAWIGKGLVKKIKRSRAQRAQMLTKIDEMHRMYLNFSSDNQRAIAKLESMIKDTGQCRAERTREVNEKFDEIEDEIKKNEISGAELKIRVDGMSESLKDLKNQLAGIEKKVDKSQMATNLQFDELNKQLSELRGLIQEIGNERKPLPVPYPPEEQAPVKPKIIKKTVKKASK